MPHKMLNKILMSVSFIFVIACSTLMPKPAPLTADIEKEEHTVYSFFVGADNAPVLILQETSTNISEQSPKELRQSIKAGFKNISNETIDSYLARNKQPSKLSPDMNLGVGYTLLTLDELAKISSQPNWGEILAEKYPGSHGYTIFSRVGFNNTLDQAVIYVAKVAGPMMGSGSYYLLEKKDGAWLLMDQVNYWIS
jgi:hypothetical protein